MHKLSTFFDRLVRSSSGDSVVAALVGITSIVYLGFHGLLRWSLVILVLCTAIAIRRRYPIAAAGVITVLCVGLRLGNEVDAINAGPLGNVLTLGSLLTVFLVSYSLGTNREPFLGLAGVVLLAIGINLLSNEFNPFLQVIALGPWLAGLVIRSRRGLSDQLEARGRELEAEKEIFARESVRYERTRIARELHDIVAHCVSVMVVQATAGQRLITADPSRAGEALDSIALTANQAEGEVGRLVRLLGGEPSTNPQVGLDLIDQLVRQTSATETEITCRFEGTFDKMSAGSSDAAYRVVQEGLTNALKHAPGASVHIFIRQENGQIKIEVVNGPARFARSGLESAGGGNGLNGMKERIAAVGGHLTFGPTDAGWQVLAAMPTGDVPEESAIEPGATLPPPGGGRRQPLQS